MTAATPDSPVQRTPDIEGAVTFLAEQADCLVTGLTHVDDPLAVRAVLRSHDSGHDRWLRLIATATEQDRTTGELLAALYALHGRVAGCLERGMRQLPGPGIQGHVSALIAAQLRSSTDQAIAALHAS